MDGLARIVVHGREASTGGAEESFGPGEVNFAERFRAALRRRLQPQAMLHVKQLAHAIGKSDRAVQMMLAGDTTAHGATVAACVDFFWRIGDRGFVAEIYGLPPLMPVAEAKQALQDARKAIGDLLERVA